MAAASTRILRLNGRRSRQFGRERNMVRARCVEASRQDSRRFRWPGGVPGPRRVRDYRRESRLQPWGYGSAACLRAAPRYFPVPISGVSGVSVFWRPGTFFMPRLVAETTSERTQADLAAAPL